MIKRDQPLTMGVGTLQILSKTSDYFGSSMLNACENWIVCLSGLSDSG